MRILSQDLILKGLEKNWRHSESLKQKTLDIPLWIDIATSIQEPDEIHSRFLDTKLAFEKVIIIASCHLLYSWKSPPSYHALIFTGYGDCLFNYVSTLLREIQASVIHAVRHYLKMVCKICIIHLHLVYESYHVYSWNKISQPPILSFSFSLLWLAQIKWRPLDDLSVEEVLIQEDCLSLVRFVCGSKSTNKKS